MSLALAATCGACGATTHAATSPARPVSGRIIVDGRPAVVSIVREGDVRGGVAMAVTTRGIAPERGAAVGVALAALVEARLAAEKIDGVAVTGGWDGYRARATVADAKAASAIVGALENAMAAPVAKGDPALPSVARKLQALARRPLPDPALTEVADCTGEAFATGGAPSTAQELEAWREKVHAAARVAFATAGPQALADAAARVLREGPAWPATSLPADGPWPGEGPTAVYDASGQLGPGGARVIVTARTALPERAVAAATVVGDPKGALAARLAGLDAPARVVSVVATAHANGGCLATTLDIGARQLGAEAPTRIATAAALARQELAIEVGGAPAPAATAEELATRALDPAEAAERAAWWALAAPHAGPRDALELRMTVGVAPARDASSSALSLTGPIRGEIDRATLAAQARVVDAPNCRVERGQGEAWLLFASPCGTLSESTGDAGSGAVVAAAAAAEAAEADPEDHFEAFVAADGVGVLAHGSARPSEPPAGLARRLAGATARALAAEALRRPFVERARAELLAAASRSDARALAGLGDALASGHPSWLLPDGTDFGLGSLSDDGVGLRASSLRAGPLRIAILANADASQADAAVQAADRWVVRSPGRVRSCPDFDLALPLPRAETHAVSVAAGSSPEALLAYPLAGGDPVLAPAEWLAAALDGPDGMLAHALGAGGGAPPLARSWSASVLGIPRRPSLVVRLIAPGSSLDAAVAQTRALLDRIRQGALQEADRTRARDIVARAELARALDPRARVIALWRGSALADATAQVPLDAWRAFAAATLREDSLVIVAARAPRLDSDGQPFTTARDTKPGSRETGVRR